MSNYTKPSELANHLLFLGMIDADFKDEFGTTTESAFAEAYDALEHFIELTPSEVGKGKLEECIRNLHTAFKFLQDGDDSGAGELIRETEELFKKYEAYIVVADE
ncbi:hypothetical protein [Aeoliella sp. SH292]|uniref:hypothetical protein n=1 Tax=Aeoliella sp. SH292 TaxID=3454464 RepID=UPI003F9DEA1D